MYYSRSQLSISSAGPGSELKRSGKPSSDYINDDQGCEEYNQKNGNVLYTIGVIQGHEKW